MLRWLTWLDDAAPPSLLEAVFKKHVDEDTGDSFYGYGWVVMDSDVGEVRWHDGSNGVFYAMLFWLPERDVFVVGFTNGESRQSAPAITQLARIAVGLRP